MTGRRSLRGWLCGAPVAAVGAPVLASVSQALGQRWPSVAFAVRTDVRRGLPVVRATWTDGPPTEQVRQVLAGDLLPRSRTPILVTHRTYSPAAIMAVIACCEGEFDWPWLADASARQALRGTHALELTSATARHLDEQDLCLLRADVQVVERVELLLASFAGEPLTMLHAFRVRCWLREQGLSLLAALESSPV